MNFRLRGDKRKLSAAEINRWNKLADQQARGELRRLPPVTLRAYDPNARVVRAKNESGSDRVAYDCMAIDGLLWDLEADGSADVVFSLITADPDKAPAILLEPIADDGVGLVVIDGPAIAKIDQATDAAFRWADPQASTHSLEAAASGSIKLLQAPSTTGSKIMPVILNAGAGGEPTRFFRYALTADMGTSSTTWIAAATANLSGLGHTENPTGVVVHDVLGHASWQVSGGIGICFRGEDGDYFIVTPSCDPDCDGPTPEPEPE